MKKKVTIISIVGIIAISIFGIKINGTFEKSKTVTETSQDYDTLHYVKRDGVYVNIDTIKDSI